MKTKKSLVFAILMVFALIFSTPQFASAAQSTNDSYPLSPGVKYSNYTHKGSKTNVVNHLEVDLSNSFTKISLGLPTPVNTLMTTTQHANSHSKEGNRVVGAINSNFYNMTDGYPLYLISQNNNIITPSVISSSSSNYVSQPIAFGITKDGNGEIAYYNSKINVTYNGETNEVNGLNVKRADNEAVIYTPQNHSSMTPNGGKGMEFIVETGNTVGSTKFGQTLTGKVTAIRGYDDETKAKIPRNGFVLSFNGSTWGDKYRGIKIGDEISVNFSIDNRWMDAQFMMASGPLLVMDGKKNVTMNESSSRARETAPRTAIAISKDKKKVHLITVDGRVSSSAGMTLTQFADYLVSLGVDRAINLDGGGSTTMGIRKYGSNTVVLANTPSGGSQRRVSAIIEAVSTAPTTNAPKHIQVTRDKVGTLLVGATVKLTPNYVLDEHYNPLNVNAKDFVVTSQNNTVTVNGLSYTAVSAGSERLTVSNQGAAQSISFNVVDAPAGLSISGVKGPVEPNASIQLKANVTGANNETLIYDESQIEWSIDGDIGSVFSSGVFKSNGKEGTARVTATLGTKSVSTQIVVQAAEKALFKDISVNNRYKTELTYLVDNKLIGGYPDGTFKPDLALTRGQAAVLLTRALGLSTKDVANPGFTDLSTNSTYYGAVAAIVQAGIMNGTGDGKFEPGKPLTRAQMAKILVEAYSLTGTIDAKFKDVSAKHWAYDYIHTLAANKITTGYEDNTFKPSVEVSRMHFSLFLYRTITKE
ncbi:S-layer homology domain-containing protein [Solibacillus silvestris]|uniref:S-layer homology domain-containing protein n=1 Tax=Solibacillus silvestris TaxID=76853 RepID=UPI003F809FCA